MLPLVLIWEKHSVYSHIPHVFEEEWVARQIKRMLSMKVSLILGSLQSGTATRMSGRNKKVLLMCLNFTLFHHLHAAQHVYWKPLCHGTNANKQAVYMQ